MLERLRAIGGYLKESVVRAVREMNTEPDYSGLVISGYGKWIAAGGGEQAKQDLRHYLERRNLP